MVDSQAVVAVGSQVVAAVRCQLQDREHLSL